MNGLTDDLLVEELADDEPDVYPRRRSPAANAARSNAIVAVEHDPVRRHDQMLDQRLAAAIFLAPTVALCDTVLSGGRAPADRLDPRLVAELDLHGHVALDELLALEVLAQCEHRPDHRPGTGQ